MSAPISRPSVVATVKAPALPGPAGGSSTGGAEQQFHAEGVELTAWLIPQSGGEAGHQLRGGIDDRHPLLRPHGLDPPTRTR